MNIFRKIKQHFCRHIDDPFNRNYIMPFNGYIFQCPKCGGYVACFNELNEYTDISEQERDLFIKEGEKLWKITWDREE